MVKVYGADWCRDTVQAIAYLESKKVDYEYINVEKDEEASQWVKDQNGGKERKPTIAIDNDVLSVPSENDMNVVLQRKGLIS